MPSTEIQAVTGAYGFSGRYIARRLLDAGQRVITLTNSFCRSDPFGGRVTAYPLSFDRPDSLERALAGVSVLYNTYYVRFNYRGPVRFTYADAVSNSAVLFNAAKRAGVKRVVHISITNASENSRLEYFRGKAEIEQLLMDSGLSYSILRPAVLFGDEGILINNIAYLLRKFPLFGVFGNGRYRLQPIYVDDLAALAVEKGKEEENGVINAIGPETFAYRELIKKIGLIIGKPRPIIPIPPSIGFVASSIMGSLLNDRLVTWDEIKGLMEGLLYVDSPPTGETRLTEWAKENSSELGNRYFSELGRRMQCLRVKEKTPVVVRPAPGFASCVEG